MSMFCNQCEQTAHGTGCEKIGVCGKSPEVSALQDLLVNAVAALPSLRLTPRPVGSIPRSRVRSPPTRCSPRSPTSTSTPHQWPARSTRPSRFARMKARVRAAGGDATYDDAFANLDPGRFGRGQDRPGRRVRLTVGSTSRDLDVQSLQETTLYGMKGVGAYEHHARQLGVTDTAIYSYLFKALAAMADQDLDLNAWVGLAMECGATNLRTMEILDEALGRRKATRNRSRPRTGR